MTAFLTVAVFHLLALVSPGPDFLLATKNSLTGGRSAGYATAVGFGLGILVHVTYCLLGIGVLISQSILLFNVVKLAGAAYLVYIGIQSMRSRQQTMDLGPVARTDITLSKALWMGFLTNALNPKATLFMLALFTQVIDPATPLPIQILYGLYMGVQTVAWFSIVAVVLSASAIRERFLRVSHVLDRVFGAALIALGVKVALSTRE